MSHDEPAAGPAVDQHRQVRGPRRRQHRLGRPRMHLVGHGTALRVVGAAESIGYHATSLLKRRMSEVPRRTLGFLLQKQLSS